MHFTVYDPIFIDVSGYLSKYYEADILIYLKN